MIAFYQRSDKRPRGIHSARRDHPFQRTVEITPSGFPKNSEVIYDRIWQLRLQRL
jgi:hypothetical protein